jgi:2-dehydropantoate 2-reductase
MRILVIGAGAIGGYFGGRLLEAGRDVTFLVRPRRAEQLAATGLVLRSPHGAFHAPAPPTVTADALRETFDLILLSCKAYDLASAIADFAPAVGENTAILPLLNGIRHLDVLDERFGPARVLGGQCLISAALDSEGRILHLNETHSVAFGERDGSRTARAEAIAAEMDASKFNGRLSEAILQEMWEKWVFIATGAGITCLMRAAFGDIVAAGGVDLITALFDECASIAARQGFPPGAEFVQKVRAILTLPGSALMASMLRDVERGAPTEADHILGDLLQRDDERSGAGSMLFIAYAHLKAYEARRARESSPA